VMTEVLEHLEADAEALQEVRRVLKPGGVVAITVPNARYPFWWDPVNRTRERLGLSPVRRGFFGGIWTNHLRLYRQGEIVALVRRSGLEVCASRTLVRYCLPFSHNLVYGFGKWAVESGLLAGADRFETARTPPPSFSPLRWALRLINAIDRRNLSLPDDAEPSVSIAVKAIKPVS